MISFSLGLNNPFCSRWKTVFYREYLLGKNKASELQVVADNSIIGIDFNWTARHDHAGVDITLSLAGYSLLMSIHDTRHWDTTTKKWKVY